MMARIVIEMLDWFLIKKSFKFLKKQQQRSRTFIRKVHDSDKYLSVQGRTIENSKYFIAGTLSKL